MRALLIAAALLASLPAQAANQPTHHPQHGTVLPCGTCGYKPGQAGPGTKDYNAWLQGHQGGNVWNNYNPNRPTGPTMPNTYGNGGSKW